MTKRNLAAAILAIAAGACGDGPSTPAGPTSQMPEPVRPPVTGPAYPEVDGMYDGYIRERNYLAGKAIPWQTREIYHCEVVEQVDDLVRFSWYGIEGRIDDDGVVRDMAFTPGRAPETTQCGIHDLSRAEARFTDGAVEIDLETSARGTGPGCGRQRHDGTMTATERPREHVTDMHPCER